MNDSQQISEFMLAVNKKYGNITSITRDQINELVNETGLSWPRWLTSSFVNRHGNARKGKSYDLPIENKENNLESETKRAGVRNFAFSGSMVPTKLPYYTPFGFHDDLTQIIKKKKWFPVFISGHSGNGKTTTVEQVCADLGRDYIRINITTETCEDDLLGGMRLLSRDGGKTSETVFQYGPVVEAMMRGAVCLLDEIDYGTNKISCLQSVLEGNPIFLKKICEKIVPAPGFNIIATANTKGKGDESGRYTGTSILNEALLDRFSAQFEQDYPAKDVELKILLRYMEIENKVDQDFAEKLVAWANLMRENFNKDIVQDVITTRRLIHILSIYSVFEDRAKAVLMALRRFDKPTQDLFWDTYTKIDDKLGKGGPTINMNVKPPEPKKHAF